MGGRETTAQFYSLTGPYDSGDKLILEYQTLISGIRQITGKLVLLK
jgi:hypothetical protein